MKKNIVITVVAVVLACVLVTFIFPGNIQMTAKVNIDLPSGGSQSSSQTVPQNTPTQAPTQATTQPDTPAAKQGEEKKPVDTPVVDISDIKPSSGVPQTNQEIVQKYTEVMNKFKAEKPAYQKKEYQELPDEYRNFSSVVNTLLKFADGYMTKEDDEKALVVRDKGAAEITTEIPVYGIDKGCILLDFDPALSSIKAASCDDLGNGTYKIKLTLNDEKNPEPTPADTGVAVSAHGAVFAPGSRADIMVEVEKVEKLSGAKCNSFDLDYTDCSLECTYDSEGKLIDLVQHMNIDISADIKILFSEIQGSARLTNDMHVYDVVW